MHTKFKKICCFSCIVLIGVMFTGCDGKKEELPETKVVKAFKIENKQEKKIPSSEIQTENKELAVKPVAEFEVGQKLDSTAADSDSKTAVSIQELPVVEETKIVVDTVQPEAEEEQKNTYNPKGRINPFTPLFQPTTVSVVRANDKPQSAREARLGRLTALEKLDLSQLKLTGIMYLPAANRSMAMVEETTGKGHVIKKGTYVGVNSGRVIEIKENVVTIEEEVENYMGDIVVRKRELKLQKPLGEG